MFPLRTPRLLSPQTLLLFLSVTLAYAASYASLPNQAHWQVFLTGWLLTVCGYAGVVIVRVAAIRRAGGLGPITVTDSHFEAPANALSRKMVRVPIERVRSVALVGRGPFARLLIDAGRRAFVFPAAMLEGAAVVEQLQAALEASLSARPDGAALGALMARRHRLSRALGGIRPVGTWVMVAVIAAVFAVQMLVLPEKDPFALIDMGANASALVWQGQWFRLITASLLHLSARHVLGNAVSLLVIGAMVERLVGLRHCLILLLGSCIVSQIVSAAAGALPNGHLFSVGLSGGIFGLLGALGAITWRFGKVLPAGLRLQGRRWAVLVLIYALALPLLVPQIDSWAHGGGALAGFCAGALLCFTCPDAESLRRPYWHTQEAFAALLTVFGVGIGAQAWHASIDGAHAADRLALAETVFYRPNVAPLVRNALAWEIATEPGAPPVLLRWGRALADQGARQQRNIDGRSRIYAAVVDTEAVLEYRLGDPVRATRLEAELPWRLQPMGSHLALFLDTLLRERGSQVVGEEGPPAPAITVENGVLRLSQPAPAPQGARVYAVLRGRNGLAGVLFFHLPPNFSGTQILPLPGSQGAPGMAAPDPVWTDGRTTIEVGLFDRRGCYCSWPEMGPHFAPYTPDPDISP